MPKIQKKIAKDEKDSFRNYDNLTRYNPISMQPYPTTNRSRVFGNERAFLENKSQSRHDKDDNPSAAAHENTIGAVHTYAFLVKFRHR